MRRNGIAMILVMIAVTMVFVIGMSVLAGVPASTRTASNQFDRDAAVYLAESGLAEALYRLANPPAGVTGIWSGAAGRSLPGVSGSYSVAVANLSGNIYRITATGTAPGSNGVTVTHAVTMSVQVDPSPPSYPLRGSTAVGAATTLPPGSQFWGDVSVVGSVTNLGDVEGTLSATGLVVSVLPGQADGVDPFSGNVAPPPTVEINDYWQYTYDGQTYDALRVTPAEVASLPQTMQPTNASNPLGVVIVDGNLSLTTRDLEIDGGILVATGEITVTNHELHVRGVPGYFSLIVQGNMRFGYSGELRVDDAPAFIRGEIQPILAASNLDADFRGGLVTQAQLPAVWLGSFEVRDGNSDPSAVINARYFGNPYPGNNANDVTELTYTIGPGG